MYTVQTTTVGFSTNSIKNTDLEHVTLEPITIIAIQPVHLLLGLFGFIFLFLIIIAMKRRKKSFSLKGQAEQGQTSHGDTAQGGSSSVNNHGSYNNISEQIIDHPYRSLEVHYDEIDESLQLSIFNAPNPPNSLTGRQKRNTDKSIETLNKSHPNDQE